MFSSFFVLSFWFFLAPRFVLKKVAPKNFVQRSRLTRSCEAIWVEAQPSLVSRVVGCAIQFCLFPRAGVRLQLLLILFRISCCSRKNFSDSLSLAHVLRASILIHFPSFFSSILNSPYPQIFPHRLSTYTIARFS